MKSLWLLGADIAGSPSPAMHNAALAALGVEPVYALYPCGVSDLPKVLEEAVAGCRGINVTAPHKIEVARRWEELLDADARAAGAVNTVVFDGGRAVRALNTDVEGLLVAWRRANLHVRGRTVAVVGAGGAARAVVVAAARAGACGVEVHARNPAAATALAERAASLGLAAAVMNEPARATLAVLAATDLDEPARWIGRALGAPAAVHDLRYGPRTGTTRDAALRAGHLYADGSQMLLGQAEAALAAFRGEPLPEAAVHAMRRALASFLRSR